MAEQGRPESARAGRRKGIRDTLIEKYGKGAVLWITAIDRNSYSSTGGELAEAKSSATEVNVHVAAECFVSGSHRLSTDEEIEAAQAETKKRQDAAKVEEIKRRQTTIIMTPQMAESMGLAVSEEERPRRARGSKSNKPPEGENGGSDEQ